MCLLNYLLTYLLTYISVSVHFSFVSASLLLSQMQHGVFKTLVLVEIQLRN